MIRFVSIYISYFASRHRPCCVSLHPFGTGLWRDLPTYGRHGLQSSGASKKGTVGASKKVAVSSYPIKSISNLAGGFNVFFMFIPKIGEMIHFDFYFSNGLKPPTSNLQKNVNDKHLEWSIKKQIH